MPDVNETKPVEKYKSTKLLSGLGGWSFGGWIGGAVALPFTWSGVKDVSKLYNRFAAGETVTKAQIRAPLAKLSTLLVLPLVGAVIGAVSGYKRGKKAEAQYNDVTKDLALAQQQVGQLTEVVALEREQNKKFTDVIASRRQHGSQHAAVNADKQHAAEAEMAL